MTITHSCVTERVIYSLFREAFWKIDSHFGAKWDISIWFPKDTEYLFTGNRTPLKVSQASH